MNSWILSQASVSSSESASRLSSTNSSRQVTAVSTASDNAASLVLSCAFMVASQHVPANVVVTDADRPPNSAVAQCASLSELVDRLRADAQFCSGFFDGVHFFLSLRTRIGRKFSMQIRTKSETQSPVFSAAEASSLNCFSVSLTVTLAVMLYKVVQRRTD